MQTTDLPYSGGGKQSFDLRRICAQAISGAEQRAARGGVSPELVNFFKVCHQAVVAANKSVVDLAAVEAAANFVGPTQPELDV